MLGLSAKLPVTDEDRLWVDAGFRRLERMLGRRRMLEARVVAPTAKDFPDPYNKTPEAAELLFQRVCGYTQVDRKQIELEFVSGEGDELREVLPYWRGSGGGWAGLTTHSITSDGAAPEANTAHDVAYGTERYKDVGDADGLHGSKQVMVVTLRGTNLDDPLSLVATMAHELGHVILIGGGLLDPRTTPDHEPLTDLLTVYLGLGVFTANCAARFRQWQDERRQGWSMQRLGYLPEEVFGYALARFARERKEEKPVWVGHLGTNIRAYFKRSRAWLEKNDGQVISAAPIG